MFHRIERSHRLVALGFAAAAVAISSFPIAGMSAVPDAGHDRRGVAGSRAEAANYTAEMVAAGGYKAGAEGTVQVTVVPKGGYHFRRGKSGKGDRRRNAEFERVLGGQLRRGQGTPRAGHRRQVAPIGEAGFAFRIVVMENINE